MKIFVKTILLLVLPALARAQQSQQKQLDSLHLALNRAANDTIRMGIYRDISQSYQEINRDSAILYNTQAITLARKLDFKLNEAQYLADLGYVKSLMGKYPEALKSFFQAFKIEEDRATEKHPYYFTYYQEKTVDFIKSSIISDIYHKLGHLYGFTGNTDKQILNYRKTERIATSIQDTVMLALVNMNLTWAYTSVGKLDSALFCGKKSLEYYSGLPNFGGKRYYESEALRDVGEVYRKMGKIGMAKQTLLQAIKVGTEQNNLSVLGYAYFSFADLYYGEKKADSSLFYARRALGVANQVKDESLKARIFDLLYSIYFKKSQPDSAFAYLKLSHALKDSLNNDERKKIREFQNMGFDEQLRLDELEKEKIQTQSNIRTYSLLAGLAILSVIGFILYRNNRQKQKANKVLESTLTNLKATQAQLIQSEKLASLGELTAGIAHEIQNPLNFVNNFSEMSVELVSELLEERNKENGKRDEELEKELLHDLAQNQEKINHHGKRASSIVKGMLEHSRASTGVRELTDINKLADEYLRLTYHGLRAKDKDFNAELITEFDENLPKIEVIPQDIGRVLLNLINNAFWAVKTVEKPLVVVKTEQADNQIIIKVSDNGIGMTEDVKAKIFQPFFTTKPTGEGTGLGLSLAYDIVTKGHEGTIEVESVEGEGTTFVVKLPSSAINSQ